MSNIDKQALREATTKAMLEEGLTWWDEAQLKDGVVLHQADAAFVAIANPATVLALLDELEAADALNKHLDLAIRKAEGCSEALRRKLEVAEESIAELSELLMKSDVEKKQPQNTLSGRPVYLGDGRDAKETLIAGKREIHRYESSITDRAWKGD